MGAEHFGARTKLIPSLKWAIVTAYLPLCMLLAATLPMINGVLFSLHGGIGWYLLMLCGPATALKLVYDAFLRKQDRIPITLCCIYFATYIGLTFLLGAVAQRSLEKWAGFEFSHYPVWSAMNLPWSYLASPHSLAM
jgi:hypothetical protein